MELMGVDTAGMEVDHVDGNALNQAWSNLRLATRRQNSWNTGPRRGSKSGEKGVYWHDRTRTWRVRVTAFGKEHSGGYFKNKDEAILKRKQLIRELHGDYARQK